MKKKIVVVDDEQGIRLLLQEILETYDYDVITAKTGKEVFEILEVDTFDLLIIDYKLPGMDGAEVLKKIEQEGTFSKPVIMMSGLVENIDDRIKNIPFVKGILAKPFQIDEFIKLIQSILG
ncbi:MAG TPA: response regulator [Bacillota bacterium]